MTDQIKHPLYFIIGKEKIYLENAKEYILKLRIENKKLQAQKEIYEECRAFYADKGNWSEGGWEDSRDRTEINDQEHFGYGMSIGGKLAREAGEKIKAIENN